MFIAMKPIAGNAQHHLEDFCSLFIVVLHLTKPLFQTLQCLTKIRCYHAH